jgi:hypothetical protein
MARKKEPTDFEIRSGARRTRQFLRDTISEQYDGAIAAVEIEYQRGPSEADAALFNATPEHRRSASYGPDHAADFAFDCYSRACVSGLGEVSGYVLNDVIDQMARSHEKTATGRIFCRAWQDFRRIGVNGCLTEFSYRVRITYAEALDGPASRVG